VLFASNTGDFQSVTTGNWSAIGTWQTYNGSAWVAATAVPDLTQGITVTIQSGNTVTLDAAYTANNAALNIVVNGYLKETAILTKTAGIWTINGTYELNHISAGGSGLPTATWNNGSTCNITGITVATTGINASQSFYNLTFNCPGMTASLNLGWNTGTIAIRNNFTISNTGSGRLQVCGPAAGTSVAPTTVIVNIGGNLVIDGTSAVSTTTGVSVTSNGTSNNYNAITINVSGNVTVTGNSLANNAYTNFSISKGTQGGTGTSTWNFYGDVSISNATMSNSTTTTSGGLGKFVFAKSGTQALTLSNINSTAAAINMEVLSGSTLNIGSSNLTPSNGFFTLDSGAGIMTSSATGLNGNLTNTGTKTLSPAANYTFNGSSAQVTSTLLPATVNDLIINNAAGVTLSQATTVNGTLALTSGTLTNSTYNVTLGSSATISLAGGLLSVAPAFGASVNLAYNGSSVQGNEFPTTDIINTLTINNTGGITLSDMRNIPNLSIASGSSLTVNAGKQLTVSTSLTNYGTMNLLSTSGAGTATILTPATINGNGTATVQQYLPSGRNWYISSPVTSGATNIITGTSGNALYSYYEPSFSWSNPTGDTNFGVAKGYVANMASSGVVTFTGGALNNGALTKPSLTSSGATEKGFNLVGNPYPSYLNWLSVLASGSTTASMEPTMWYRTQSTTSAYVFDTFNATAGEGTNNNGYAAVTGMIPPMQAFWVRVTAGNTGILGFDNTMRSHQDQSVTTNRLKAPAVANTAQQVLRLQVSNALNSDEAIVLFNPNASDEFDVYDSEKMSNNDATIPEIYTLAGTEQVAINGLNSIATNPVLPLGFKTGTSNSFTIKATEISNFDSDTKIILKDNVLNTEQDLTDGSAYTFTSDVDSTTSRFSVVFKSVGFTTGVQTASGDPSTLIYKNANNQIAVNCNGAINDNASITVYNALGQKLELKKITNTTTIIDKAFTSGVYVVTVNNGGKSTTKKVILN
jgi:hypothetical protein